MDRREPGAPRAALAFLLALAAATISCPEPGTRRLPVDARIAIREGEPWRP